MGGPAMTSELYLCLYAREFPAQALLRLRPELRAKAVAVLDGEPPFEKVCSLNRHARSLGVMPAMSRAEMESFPSVTVLKRSLAEEQSARGALLACAGSFSPRVEDNSAHESFLCVLDISGTEKLFGAPRRLATRVQQTITELGVTCSLAVSANFHAAVCMAKATARSAVIIPAGDEQQALAALPLSVLTMTEEHAETFSQWGISSLGMLAALPERDLIARLGQDGQRLRQLARGAHPHLFLPVEPVLTLEERIELDSPVEILDSLLFGVSLMTEQLITRASARLLTLAAITSELGLEGGAVHSRIVRPALPGNDKQLWLKLLHLDWIAHPPQAPVISLMLRAETGEASTVQLGLFSPQLPEAGRLDVTLARIRAIVGDERVGSAELKDTHAHDAFRMKPFSVVPAACSKAVPVTQAAVMRRLRPAEPVTVRLRERCPHLFYFRGMAYQAEKSYGPWRAASGWWTKDGWSIEAWDIVARAREHSTANRELLCCSMTRDLLNNQWRLEALYD
jgi:protein ImuB